jgi:hypothetical protein
MKSNETAIRFDPAISGQRTRKGCFSIARRFFVAIEARSTHVCPLQADDFNVGLRSMGREREVG